MKYFITIILAISIFVYVYVQFGTLSPVAPNESITGKVVKVIDGDSLMLKSGSEVYKIELAGVDAPEHGQAFGLYSEEYLEDLVKMRVVIVDVHSKDRDGYLTGELFLDDLSINKLLLRDGYVWAKRSFLEARSWVGLEKLARDKGFGLWRDGGAMPPWEFRELQHDS